MQNQPLDIIPVWGVFVITAVFALAFVEIGNASFTFRQKIVHASDGRLLIDSKVTMVCAGPGRKARRLPKEILQALQDG